MIVPAPLVVATPVAGVPTPNPVMVTAILLLIAYALVVETGTTAVKLPLRVVSDPVRVTGKEVAL